MEIIVVRLSHRIERDKRLTTHVALCSRAFLAKKMVYSGQKDSSLENTIEKLRKNWGGKFEVLHVEDAEKALQNLKNSGYYVVLLSMHGENLKKRAKKLLKMKKIAVIVGGEKVDGFAYQLSDEIISITNQPHSEVSALAIFLHELNLGKELEG